MRPEQALRNILRWQQAVLRDPYRLLHGLEGDFDGIAIALFFGPIWEDAHGALRGTEFEIKSA